MKAFGKMASTVMVVILICATQTGCFAASSQSQGFSVPEEVKTGVFGDANHDGVIDDRDIEYASGIISGKNERTRFADANQDDKVDQKDIEKIRSIISGEEKELTVIDSKNRVVTVSLPIKSIVILSTGSPACMLRILGEIDKVVAINRMIKGDHFFPELQDKPPVGYPAPDYEAIVKIKPDLVIASANPAFSYDIVNQMEPFGIKVLQLDLNGKPGQYLTEMKVLGQIMGKSKEAQEYVDFCESNIGKVQEIVNKLDPDKKKTVYYEFIQDYNVPGRANGIITEAGGTHILADIFQGDYLEHKSLNIDPEEIAEKNPDVIIKDPHVGFNWSGYAPGVVPRMEKLRTDVMARPAWVETNAVKNGEVYIIARELGNERMIADVFISKMLYPEEFKEIDASAILKEWLERFHNRKYDDYAVIVYHPDHSLR
jgi:iron complex transport system substrate-binding protein